MKIEAGKFYRTRNGKKAGPALDWGSDHGAFRWCIPINGHPSTFDVNGYRLGPNIADDEDLILEWYDDADPNLADSIDDCTELYKDLDVDLSSVNLAPTPSGYGDLHSILQDAYDQSATGKGRERHGSNKPFDRQPIMEIGRMVGPGYAIGQAMKKLQEAMTMQSRQQFDAADRELLGAIVYAAASVKLIRENRV